MEEGLLRGQGLVPERAVLAVVLMEIVHGAEHIDAVLTVVGARLDLWTLEVVAQVVLIGQRNIKAQAVALLLAGTYAYHCPHLSIVLGTRGVDDLHVADVLAMQTLQFAGIAHLATINIYKRGTLAQHLWRFVSTCHAWHLDEHLAQCARLSQRCAFDARNHCTCFQTGVGEAALDDDFLQLHQFVYRFCRVLLLCPA